ncbi:M23 family metallopeptidase [Sphingomonas rubra]|uniref:Murein DD-endopeptidase MepM and murein hydrolase activator NlpD, contain LysM domain n=1 Tax=Sphingomonas rubra TaxID=634430 RepID=A0A1I5RXN7_9SPHN|nr:M23 family metallopeptidase [Sphingomonas rubra]SFP63081.1 Murein DD-endopeptidase MepM and murein hydrolase activator NlpD, contain LysM domain [Sphingomonas rubra]
MRRAAAAMMAVALGGCIPRVDGGDARYATAAPPPVTEQPRDLPGADEGADEQVADSESPDRPVGRVDLATSAPARPAWEARPVAADAREVADGSVVVAPGDTLRRIADRAGVGLEAIARANDLQPPFTIRAGQRLAVPGGRYHLVRSGESGIAIARAYGVEWSRIVSANQLAEPYVLRAGQRIAIPGPAAAAASRAAERAAAFRLDVDDILTGGEPALAANQAPARPTKRPTRTLPPSAAVAPPVRLAGGGFVWPVDGQVVKRFGRGASGERNDGIKIAVPVSTPVVATADGVVAYAGDGIAALGGLVIIKHGGGWTSVYGHASKLLVSRGQSVKRGQTIALSGDTGFADRPEVHFELRRGRTPVDPQGQLSRS